jgi:agmatinase
MCRIKIVGLVGGDHSTPLGFMEALAERYSDFGILQFDAHCDLREAYEGFEYSHASIMYNALKIPQVKKLVQVGIRDWCEAENEIINNSKGRVKTFFDYVMKRKMYEGESWRGICSEIISHLPRHIYISFDIDGLDPKLCPNTGTPVPGGLEFEQAVYLISQVAASGKKIIGFDLNEVAPGDSEWNGNVGARLLYKMCNLTAVSNGIAKWS